MAITDIFSSSFLFSIAIIIILIGGIFAYVSFRMAEQDNKLNAMIGLISTMADESQFFRSRLQALQQKINEGETHNIHLVEDDTNKHISISSQQGGNLELIDVSDDETLDEDEDELDEDEDELDEYDNESDNGDDNESDNGDDNESDNGDEDEEEDKDEEGNDNIKILNLSLANNHSNTDTKMDDFEQDLLEQDLYVLSSDLTEINAEPVENVDLSEHKTSDIKDELKNISINADLWKGEEETDKTDYKKMPLTKLRELVVSKGLTNDAGKLKKNDILKLLEN